jgi:tight adherence protein C
MNLATIVIAGFIMIGIGSLIIALGLRWFLRSDDVSSRVYSFMADQNPALQRRSSVLEFRDRELSGSLIRRVLTPRLRAFSLVLGRLTPASAISELENQLLVANNPMGLGAREFYGVRVGFTVLGLLFLFVVPARFGLNRTGILIGLLAFLVIAYLPKLWLLQRMRLRQDNIRSGLPDALDMLSVCAAAGLGFDQALQRVSEYWITDVGVEFARVISEIELGISRRDSLRNLSDRLDVTEMSSFISLLLQSEQIGMSIADTLHSQAEQMRTERRFRALEQIRKVPIKMLVPMTFLILPAMFAIILGPAVPAMLEFFENF